MLGNDNATSKACPDCKVTMTATPQTCGWSFYCGRCGRSEYNGTVMYVPASRAGTPGDGPSEDAAVAWLVVVHDRSVPSRANAEQFVYFSREEAERNADEKSEAVVGFAQIIPLFDHSARSSRVQAGEDDGGLALLRELSGFAVALRDPVALAYDGATTRAVIVQKLQEWADARSARKETT